MIKGGKQDGNNEGLAKVICKLIIKLYFFLLHVVCIGFFFFFFCIGEIC